MSQNVSEKAEQPHLPLSGIVVLDLTLARAGPTCVRHLGDWGADIIRVEPPEAQGEDVVGRRDCSLAIATHRDRFHRRSVLPRGSPRKSEITTV